MAVKYGRYVVDADPLPRLSFEELLKRIEFHFGEAVNPCNSPAGWAFAIRNLEVCMESLNARFEHIVETREPFRKYMEADHG